MSWLIDEVFMSAIVLGHELRPFQGDKEYALLPSEITYLYPDPFADYRGSTTETVDIRAVLNALLPFYNRMIRGLRRADQEPTSVPTTVVDGVRELQRIVNGAHGMPFADTGRHYANSELEVVGEQGRQAYLRATRPLPFPSAETQLPSSANSCRASIDGREVNGESTGPANETPTTHQPASNSENGEGNAANPPDGEENQPELDMQESDASVAEQEKGGRPPKPDNVKLLEIYDDLRNKTPHPAKEEEVRIQAVAKYNKDFKGKKRSKGVYQEATREKLRKLLSARSSKESH